ncbi:MAG: hypothetical protein JSW61_02970 [Candidatus Thorarchaeota archaeon]|nr:MAG: hypothetical protein JSW61_02970 [Candidatus Thorarchaeota archaeon]
MTDLNSTMSNDSDLKEAQQAANRHSMQDGFVIVMVGLVLIVGSGSFVIPAYIVFIAFFVLYGPKALESLRERYTYPRIGYVQFRMEETATRLAAGIFGFMAVCFALTLVAMFIVQGTISLDLIYGWVPAWIGMTMIGPSVFGADQTGSRYYYIFGILAVSTGFAISILAHDLGRLAISLYLVSLGLVLTITGLVTFGRFLRKFPILESAGEVIDEQ